MIDQESIDIIEKGLKMEKLLAMPEFQELFVEDFMKEYSLNSVVLWEQGDRNKLSEHFLAVSILNRYINGIIDEGKKTAKYNEEMREYEDE